MAGMIVNARDPLDHRRHAGQRPQIGSETVSLCALTQSFVHLLELRFVKLRPTACPSCPANPIWIILPPCLEPSARALTADVEFTGDLSLGTLAGGKQTRGATAAFLHGCEVTARRIGSCHALQLTALRLNVSLYYARFSRLLCLRIAIKGNWEHCRQG
jgi:hypothetical protein